MSYRIFQIFIAFASMIALTFFYCNIILHFFGSNNTILIGGCYVNFDLTVYNK